MSLLTTVIDDKSPLISYDMTWLPGTSQDDNYAVDYYLGTFQKNSATDGTATFSFNGTAFWIYGANRPNHGVYTVQVDNTNYPGINGSGNNLFQQSLFSANVNQGAHTVNLINTGGSLGLYVDIDMIVWQSEVGSTGGQLVPEIVQDMDPRFQYQQSAWGTTSSSSNLNLNLFNNGTGQHIWCKRFFHIYSEAVTLFGTSGPSNGPYSVQLDGGSDVKYNATNAYPTNYGVTIYHADNLGLGAHQIVLTNLPGASGQYLTIDYAQLWTVTNTSVSPSPSVIPCPAPSSNISQNTLSSGAIAGLVIEGMVAVLAAAAAFFFYRRWNAALATPRTLYIPLHQSPGTTTASVPGVAPSLESRSDSNTPRNNTFQPLATVGRSDNNGTAQGNTHTHVASNSFESRTVAEAATYPDQFLNVGQTSQRRLLPDAPGRPPQSAGVAGSPSAQGRPSFDRMSQPPNYDTAVRTARH
ncbi:hypothetical protein J3R83DRAFT_3339 [Lanmaoa asiatica]|nr:hypothetical protein J3R83DRAFT_3339 [Lanmaoa asiatica]